MISKETKLGAAIFFGSLAVMTGTVAGTWATLSSFESKAYNRITGARTTTWDAMWVNLQVVSQAENGLAQAEREAFYRRGWQDGWMEFIIGVNAVNAFNDRAAQLKEETPEALNLSWQLTVNEAQQNENAWNNTPQAERDKIKMVPFWKQGHGYPARPAKQALMQTNQTEVQIDANKPIEATK